MSLLEVQRYLFSYEKKYAEPYSLGRSKQKYARIQSKID